MYKRLFTAIHSNQFKLGLALFGLVGLAVYAFLQKDMLSAMYAAIAIELLPWLLLLASLTFVNLYAEVRKWLALLHAPQLTLLQGYKQVLSGMCSGFVTPNRIGDFAGRMAQMPPHLLMKAPAAAALGASIQGLVTLAFGAIGLLMYQMPPVLHSIRLHWMVGFGLVTAIILAVWLPSALNRGLWHIRLQNSVTYFKQLKSRAVRAAVKWAILRYIIFSTQFVLALYTFGYGGGLHQAYGGVFVLFFCQSFIPGPALGELGIREVLSVVLFAHFMPHHTAAVLAGFSLWLVNIGLPVLVASGWMGFKSLHNHKGFAGG